MCSPLPSAFLPHRDTRTAISSFHSGCCFGRIVVNLLAQANKFIAIRAQEKRLKLKREQEERSKKRLEDKVLRNKLLLRQQENANERNQKIAEATKQREKLRVEEIKALGYDRIDYSVRGLRTIPPDLYTDPAAQLRLSYAVSADFSHNLLNELPAKDFLYWMSSETRKLKLSGNRLATIPQDIEHSKFVCPACVRAWVLRSCIFTHCPRTVLNIIISPPLIEFYSILT